MNLVLELSLGYDVNMEQYNYTAPNVPNYMGPEKELEENIQQTAEKIKEEQKKAQDKKNEPKERNMSTEEADYDVLQ